MMTETDFEVACDAVRAQNQGLLEQFEQWLRDSGLSEKTVLTHVDNIGFYINDFLLREEPQEPEEGVDQVGWFLGDWFIRKAMWASKTSIKGNAASFKKFYGFLLEQRRIQAQDFAELKREIKDEMPEWLDNFRRYDDAGRW